MFLAFLAMGRMKRSGGLWRVCKAVYAAYRRGRRSRPLASLYWEDYWHLPIGHVRSLVCAPVES